MASTRSLASLAGALAVLPTALAGFDAGSKSNVAVYWGKNRTYNSLLHLTESASMY